MLRFMETGDDVDVLGLLFSEVRARQDRPWVMLNMVMSVDGATAVKGGASALNDEDDRDLFLKLRAVADVVLVGARTVRSEGLGPVVMSEEMRERRASAGFDSDPKLAILTRSLDLDPGHRVFSDQSRRPLIVTSVEADAGRVDTLATVGDIIQTDRLDGGGILDALGDVSVVLCEGGPTINSQLTEAGLVDEINVTLAPMLALGESKRLASGPELHPSIELILDRALLGDRSLFLRYLTG